MSRRLSLVIPSLAGGGAERVLVEMARHWAGQGDQVTLITLAGEESDAYPLPAGVTRVKLALARNSPNIAIALWNNWRRVRNLRRALAAARPQFIISFTEQMNILTLLAARGGNVPVIIAERVDPRQYAIGPLWSRLRRITYSWCRGLVVQTERARESCRPFLGRRTSVHIIPNAVSPPPVCNVRDAFAVEPGRQRIVAMGRLTHQKGFDLLIRGFAALAPRFCNWDVEILGEGPLRQELQDLIGELGLQDRIHLRGWLPDPHRLLSQADLFVLPSRFEGFPNALLEAMACGLPAIASDCDSGPAEIIRNGIDGLLIPCDDVPALTAALDRLLSDQNERRRLAGRAAEVLERFGPEKFFERWETVLAEANALCASPQ